MQMLFFWPKNPSRQARRASLSLSSLPSPRLALLAMVMALPTALLADPSPTHFETSSAPLSVNSAWVERQGGPVAAAVALVDRYRREHQAEFVVGTGPRIDLARQVTLQMAVPARVLHLIARNGFLNQHQTGRSNGVNNHHARMQFELSALHFWMPDQASLYELLPKYAYAAIQNGELWPHRTAFGSYGNVVAVFREEVKARSTISGCDSLMRHLSGSPLTMVPAQAEVSAALFESQWDGRYAEAQLWGPVMGSDVDYWLIGCDGIALPNAQEMQNLRDFGHPIYQCVRSRDGRNLERGVRAP